MIRTVGLVHIDAGRMLLVRGHGKDAFYLPGGKLDPGEDDETALKREIREELGCAVVDLERYDSFEDRAYGQPEGTRVVIACYFGGLDREPVPRAEIAEIGWFDRDEYVAMPETAPAVLQIVRDLRDRGLIG